MSQSIKLSDELYQELKGLADRECRTVPLMIQYMVQNWGVEKNKTENPAWNIPKPYCEIRSGSQANRVVATGNEHMPVRESLPDELEEALYHYKQISEDLKPEALMRWCHKQSVEEAWTDEQAKIEVDKRKQKLLAEREEVAAILKENGVSIGI
jgi:hypothetical protein